MALANDIHHGSHQNRSDSCAVFIVMFSATQIHTHNLLDNCTYDLLRTYSQKNFIVRASIWRTSTVGTSYTSKTPQNEIGSYVGCYITAIE